MRRPSCEICGSSRRGMFSRSTSAIGRLACLCGDGRAERQAGRHDERNLEERAPWHGGHASIPCQNRLWALGSRLRARFGAWSPESRVQSREPPVSDRKYRQRGYQDSDRERRPAPSGPKAHSRRQAVDDRRPHRNTRRQGRAQGARGTRAERARLSRGDAMRPLRPRVHRARSRPIPGARDAAPTFARARSASRSTPAGGSSACRRLRRVSPPRTCATPASCFLRASPSSARRIRRRSLRRPSSARKAFDDLFK